MGTRLFPQGPDSFIEKLIDVTPGTLQEYRKYRNNWEQHPDFPEFEREYRAEHEKEGWPIYEDGIEYDFKQTLPDLGRIDSFYGHGFGKLRDDTYDLLEKWGLSTINGDITDPQKIQDMLVAQIGDEGVELSKYLTGLHWE